MRGEFVDVGAERLYYFAAGMRGAGDPVLFIHGFATSALLWRDVIPLVPQGHRIIAVDLPVHGRSEGRAVHGYPPETQALVLSAFLEELRAPRVTVVAHGVGCEVGRHAQALSGFSAADENVNVPCEVILGADDPFCAVNAVRARFAPSKAHVTVLDGERHYLPEEAPDTLARVLTGLLRR